MRRLPRRKSCTCSPTYSPPLLIRLTASAMTRPAPRTSATSLFLGLVLLAAADPVEDAFASARLPVELRWLSLGHTELAAHGFGEPP